MSPDDKDSVTNTDEVTVSLLALKSTEIVGQIVEIPRKLSEKPQIVIDCYKDDPTNDDVTDSPTDSSDDDEESGHLKFKFQLTPRIGHKRNLEKKGSK